MAKKQQKAGTLYIRDVPQTTLDRLKKAANLSGRSREKQARHVLIEAYEPSPTFRMDPAPATQPLVRDVVTV